MSIRRERSQTDTDDDGFVKIPGVKAKVKLPDGVRIEPVKTTTESKPKPPQPDDPRSPLTQNTPYAG
jgi:hypothetical protein